MRRPDHERAAKPLPGGEGLGWGIDTGVDAKPNGLAPPSPTLPRRGREFVALLIALNAVPALAEDVTASDPTDLSVTIYRDPARGEGGTIELANLGGFAVVTETRRVTLPRGRARLKFEGVVDGIIPESAIVSGLPGGVIEKNRDAAVLSPSALLQASQGRAVQLRRTNRKTGKVELTQARVLSASPEGVVFETAAGQEALRCSGMPETFGFDRGGAGLSAHPVLSVETRSSHAVEAVVTLTYLAEGFDWSASYTAAVDQPARRMDIGGWITLANANSVSLADAQVQIVAGGLKREAWRRLVDGSPRVIARCWPLQRTHQIPRKPEGPYQLVRPYEEPQPPEEDYAADGYADIIVTSQRRNDRLMEMPMAVMAAPPPPPPPPAAEQLGDLKLYRLNYRTTVAANQMKQTRLLDKEAVPFERIYQATFDPLDPTVSEYLDEPLGGEAQQVNPVAVLRSRNDKAHQLGLPLPSGAFLVQQDHSGRTMLLGEPRLRDTAEDEKIELPLGPASDITAQRRTTKRTKRKQWQEVKLSNAGSEAVTLELRYRTYGSIRLVGQGAQVLREDGESLFRLTLEPNSAQTLKYTVSWD